MSSTRLWIVALIFAGIILVGFVFMVPHARDGAPAARISSEEPSMPTLALRDSFKKGLHTISGSVVAPNACVTVSATASITGSASTTQGILVTVSMPEDTGVCLERKTTLTFSTTVAAPAHLPIISTVNGVIATTTTL
jgi:hypothetical protein